MVAIEICRSVLKLIEHVSWLGYHDLHVTLGLFVGPYPNPLSKPNDQQSNTLKKNIRQTKWYIITSKKNQNITRKTINRHQPTILSYSNVHPNCPRVFPMLFIRKSDRSSMMFRQGLCLWAFLRLAERLRDFGGRGETGWNSGYHYRLMGYHVKLNGVFFGAMGIQWEYIYIYTYIYICNVCITRTFWNCRCGRNWCLKNQWRFIIRKLGIHMS